MLMSEKPLDAPLLLKTIRALLAEPTWMRPKRLGGKTITEKSLIETER